MIDLIDECGEDLSRLGYACKKEKEHGIELCTMSVKSSQEKSIGFEEGEYAILNCKKLITPTLECASSVVKVLNKVLKKMLSNSGLSKKSRILIVGLGNPNVLADSLGSKVLEKVDIFKMRQGIFKFAPNIFANTGINSFDVVGMLAVWLDIDGVVVIDSLATKSISRIATSIQVNTAGLTPGSAVHSGGKKIGKSTLGIPCIAIGVPLMFLCDELGKKDYLLTPKDINENVKLLSSIIADAFFGAIK